MDIKVKNLGGAAEKLKKLLGKRKYLLILLAAGIILLILPIGSKSKSTASSADTVSVPEFSLDEEEKKISSAISKIDGAGRVSVTLTLKSSMSQELAENERDSYRSDESSKDMDSDTTVVTVSTGSGTQSTVPVRYFYPEYQGALIICDGGADSIVKLKVTEAVASLTGLGSDRITVVKMKNQEGKK